MSYKNDVCSNQNVNTIPAVCLSATDRFRCVRLFTYPSIWTFLHYHFFHVLLLISSHVQRPMDRILCSCKSSIKNLNFQKTKIQTTMSVLDFSNTWFAGLNPVVGMYRPVFLCSCCPV